MKGPILVAAAVIENEKGEWLIARRPSHHKLAGGLWEFPGGKVEPGEEPQAAALREIREELGLSISTTGILGVSSYVYTHDSKGDPLDVDVHVVLLLFKATVQSPFEVRLNDVSEVAWVPRNKRPDVAFAPADIPFVETLWSN